MTEIIVSELNNLYENLKYEAMQMGVLCIFEISQSDINLGSEHLLSKYGIEFDFVVKTDVQDNIAVDYINNQEAKGFTTFFSKNNKVEVAIFIVSDLENEIENSLTKYVALTHEFGHFNDFVKGINFHSSGICKNLIKAEAYAEIFTLKRFHNESNIITPWVKSEYAKVILNRKNKNSFYGSVHKEITSQISESRLKNWKKLTI